MGCAVSTQVALPTPPQAPCEETNEPSLPPQPTSEFITNVDTFVESANNPNSLLGVVMTTVPGAKDPIQEQLKTFATDMRRFEKGEMSYAEMRMLYG